MSVVPVMESWSVQTGAVHSIKSLLPGKLNYFLDSVDCMGTLNTLRHSEVADRCWVPDFRASFQAFVCYTGRSCVASANSLSMSHIPCSISSNMRSLCGGNWITLWAHVSTSLCKHFSVGTELNISVLNWNLTQLCGSQRLPILVWWDSQAQPAAQDFHPCNPPTQEGSSCSFDPCKNLVHGLLSLVDDPDEWVLF